MLFDVKLKKITYLSSQNSITTNSGAKNIRFDVLVKDEAGTSYDVEMCFPIDVCVYRKTRGAVQKLQFLDSFLRFRCEFKIKSLLYNDLILNSRGCRKSNQRLRHPPSLLLERVAS